MKKRVLLLTITILLVFLSSQAALAWTSNDSSALSSNKWVQKYESLNFTEQQKAKMRELDQNTYSKTRDLRIELMDKKHELKQLRLEPNPDQNKIAAKTKEISDLREQLKAIFKQSKQEFNALLTPEQQTKIKELRNSKKDGHGAGFSR